MKQYLTISEFASLRNVNVNSIRYYEKLKILMPAYIDPQTKYRYYLSEQLPVLDTILLCIKLDIPLKTLKEYIDPNGRLNGKNILEYGNKALQEKIAEIQIGLEITQFNLNSIEQNQQYSSQKGIYKREIEERFLYTVPFHGNWNDLSQKEKTAMELFHIAQEQNMAPVFPAGILVHCEKQPLSYSFFLQVLHPSGSNQQVIHLPKASYSCLQIDLTPQTDISQVLRENFPGLDKTILISNMLLDKLYFNSRHSEIQVPFNFEKRL